MCGRYASSRDPEALVEEIEAAGLPVAPVEPEVARQLRPSFNVAPTHRVPALVHGGGGAGDGATPVTARLLALHWGLVPSWAKDRAIGSRMINARLESVTEKPSFRSLVGRRRCLLPADGWYEWQTVPAARTGGKARKQPFYMTLATPGALAFAGLHTWWRDPEVPEEDPSGWLPSTTVLTMAAEPGLDAVHDRMPVVLPGHEWAAWLDPSTPKDEALALAVEVPRGRFTAVPVGAAVGNVRNDDPSLAEPAGLDTLTGVVDPATGELYA